MGAPKYGRDFSMNLQAGSFRTLQSLLTPVTCDSVGSICDDGNNVSLALNTGIQQVSATSDDLVFWKVVQASGLTNVPRKRVSGEESLGRKAVVSVHPVLVNHEAMGSRTVTVIMSPFTLSSIGLHGKPLMFPH